MQSKGLAIPKESGLPMFSLLFQLIMFMTFIVYIQYANGQMGIAFTSPASGDNAFYIFFSFLGFTVPILLFVFTICFAKKNLKMLLLPITITPISYLLYELYSIVNQDPMFIVRQWYKVFSSFVVLILFYFTVNRPLIKSKLPIVLSTLGVIIISAVMTVAEVGPFVEKIPSFIADGKYYGTTTILYMSALLQFISYHASILFLGLALSEDGRFKKKSSRKFVVLKNMDKIHAINRGHHPGR